MQMRSEIVRFEKGLMWTLSLRPYKDLVLLNLVSDKHDVSGSIAFRDKRAKKPELRHSESCKDGTIGPAGICPSNANILMEYLTAMCHDRIMSRRHNQEYI
jgi:hypothetical protein